MPKTLQERFAAALEAKGERKVKETRSNKMHPSLTAERIVEATERQMFSLDNPGFCIACGEEADGCEPDARNYECEHCGERKVFGAAELLMRIAL